VRCAFNSADRSAICGAQALCQRFAVERRLCPSRRSRRAGTGPEEK
jgi:hypothetical protein